ncbi:MULTISPECIES: T9SS type A sorting domain-containing protein [Flavobacterium]|uniref:Secretion system C-terminal sorting domain-containing protein n=1 Tax=Flavobacterium hankyongi TaxID=1176532 RepID=A0ABP9A7L3_9FLAO|nr:T9SS type A sorting domain-containing protein [Flavobacterium sp. N1846]
MKKIYFLLLLNSAIFTAQTQIGSAINGEAADDWSGWSISLSSDGSIIAIGARNNDGNGSNSGHVRVYQNVSGVWTQIGADINGEAVDDISGDSVSLSSDGSIVAIGASRNDGNGNSSGHVRVYQNISGIWTQIGADINGEAMYDESGSSISLSSDGSIVAIGASYNAGNGAGSGHVRVYRNISGVWTQIGADIDGEAAGDRSGLSVSLSSDGSIVAMGSPYSTGSGHVRVYQNVSGVWTKIGSNINAEAGINFGSSISLSSDGSIVAIGAPFSDENGNNTGHVRVYQNLSGVWTQIGSNIVGEAAGDRSGYNISLSSDGSILAIGAYQNDGNGSNSGHVRAYRNVSGVWTQIGTDINGEAATDYCGYSVSLSSNGGVLATGAYLNDTNGSNSGNVRVYDLTTVLSSDSFIQTNFLIYPNPSNGIINISLENNLKLKKVNIYNQLGQLVKTTATNVISASELAKETYYIEVITNQGKATKKIIVE